MRVFDIRGTQKRPINDIVIKGVAPRSKMVKMAAQQQDDNYLYAGNDMGEVFELDGRKDWQISGKYKGITTTISGITIGNGQLIASSLDSYVRIFDQ